jgi:ribosome-associated protein
MKAASKLNQDQLAEVRQKAELLVRAAISKKAQNPVILKLSKISAMADYFLIVGGRSARQVRAIAEGIIEEGKVHGFSAQSTEGLPQGSWALLDYGDVVVHVFLNKVREFYDLEGLWSEAPREKIPDDLLAEIESDDDDDDEEY